MKRFLLFLCLPLMAPACPENSSGRCPTLFHEGQLVVSRLDGRRGIVVEVGDGNHFDYRVKFPRALIGAGNHARSQSDSLYSIEYCREDELMRFKIKKEQLEAKQE